MSTRLKVRPGVLLGGSAPEGHHAGVAVPGHEHLGVAGLFPEQFTVDQTVQAHALLQGQLRVWCLHHQHINQHRGLLIAKVRLDVFGSLSVPAQQRSVQACQVTASAEDMAGYGSVLCNCPPQQHMRVFLTIVWTQRHKQLQDSIPPSVHGVYVLRACVQGLAGFVPH